MFELGAAMAPRPLALAGGLAAHKAHLDMSLAASPCGLGWLLKPARRVHMEVTLGPVGRSGGFLLSRRRGFGL